MVIMLNLWGSKRAGLYIDHQKELENAHKIMNILHACDQRWNIAGRFWWSFFLSVKLDKLRANCLLQGTCFPNLCEISTHSIIISLQTNVLAMPTNP